MSGVQALAVTDNEAMLFSGDADGDLRVWDLETARSVSTTRVGNAGAGVTSINLAPDSTMLLSQSRDGAAQVFRRAPDGALRREGEISTGSYNFCRVSVLWNSGANMLGPLEDDLQPCTGHLSSALLATAGSDPAVIEVWSLHNRLKVLELSQPGPSMGMCMALQLFCPAGLPDSPHVLAGYEDGTVSLWDCSSAASPLCTLPHLHSEPVMGLALDSTASGAVSCSAGHTVTVTSINRAGVEDTPLSVLHSVDLTRPGASTVAIRPDKKIFAVGGWDSHVWIYKYPKCKPLACLQYHSAGVTDVQFSMREDSGLFVSASRDSTIALW
eukprot:CAMPEP_0117648750 /NCGR_PEP_ID=MMETSP0804-20121206/583_1 /TAXON_ID=1074897 /ORGANISM="Tetraselmis astigmatica, Strain CCMP880" /LENGTH=326 /DNA_ID=CAMNT_0005454397 /DNA_START=208 /DNA_END=1185 /DNA_ORIENTATION=+